ncbi:glycosyltransferase [Aureibaculum algae]|uniref:Glycosyltransferase n=1 Tax=Aureibaculum algae TaxID=2584122 RepID=A0A5B7TV32_9FLAO|nr:glycosyltransferase [Aureibaculum algae]QCX39133.1 glycosyltransferase [Aureibaculum algae]
MNILILTSNNPYKNSGIIAYNLYKSLKEKEHLVTIIVAEHEKHIEEDIISINSSLDILIHKIKRKSRKIIKSIFSFKKKGIKLNNIYAINDYDNSKQNYSTKSILRKLKTKPDAILYLFPNKFLNLENLYELNKATGAPIYWYLMDPAALTGGCHYFWDCNRYITGCGKCPGMYSNDVNDQSALNIEFKKKYIDKTDIHLLAGTERLLKQSKESLLFKSKPVHKLMLPVDDKVFKPLINNNNVRSQFDIPNGIKVLFFGSTFIEEIRKGMSYLVKALKFVQEQNKDLELILLIAGNNIDSIKAELPFEYRYVNMLKNNEELASAFQAADFYICPSIEDAGPFMINQSVMSGTPVISFEMGIANDLVIPNRTGFLAELKNTNDLGNKIIEAMSLNDKELLEMSTNCRNLGLELLSQSVFVANVEKIFINKQ